MTRALFQIGIRRKTGAKAGLRRIRFRAAIIPLALFGCTGTQSRPTDSGEASEGPEAVAAQVIEMLHASAASWNAGDLDGFLDDYWRSEDLTFSGGTGVTRGWDEVRQRYLRSYWGPDVSRDSLRFEELEVTALGENHALALGRYVLFRPEEGGAVTGTGHFSLVLTRLEGSWRIIHDHTSATPSQEGVD
ncbi:MAG: YybH family protein [Longimicrobiales bacterium]